jgi:cation diffusion facilitator CzcD-associated flavoprotein CzcO
MAQTKRAALREDADVVIVGAGFAGLYMLHKARGAGLTARVFEAGGGIGGTWYFNRYPGARCDVESMEYSYSFDPALEQEWQWTERYAPQAEILKYVNHVADRYDLRRDVVLETRVTSAVFDEGRGRWTVETDKGDRVTGRYCVMATGCLSVTNLPPIKGIESFKKPIYHTGAWPHEGVDFTGLRVAVIGTGSSAIQSIPLIAEQAKQLTVFQRTPTYSIPAHNRQLSDEEQRAVKAEYPEKRKRALAEGFAIDMKMSETPAGSVSDDEVNATFETVWARGGLGFMGAFADLVLDKAANDKAAEFIRGKIRSIVKDPKTAARLSPPQVVGCKRLCVDTNYFATFNRDNVELVDLRETPIEAITPDGVQTSESFHPIDALVMATGFDAITGALNRIDIRGRDAARLSEAWADGPRSYLGLQIAGFPNLFMIAGPGSPSVLTNMMVSIQHHVDWITDAMTYLSKRQLATIEPSAEAQEAWVKEVELVANSTLFPACNSWYVGANIPGRRRAFPAYVGFPPYAEKCAAVVANGYEGFSLAPQTSAAE